mgnify:CR=1 FL=1
MPVVIKEMHIRTVVEKRIVTEVEVSGEVENRVRDRLDAEDSIRLGSRQWQRKKNER